MGGFWINAAKNPGRYARQFGKEYLKHVPWQLADKVDHNLNLFSYEKCRDPKKYASYKGLLYDLLTPFVSALTMDTVLK